MVKIQATYPGSSFYDLTCQVPGCDWTTQKFSIRIAVQAANQHLLTHYGRRER
ncbi:hypothetical protein [Carbonactinospora thermoautotrophica]|uniref:hypothetical protein n=1 Tax=Carbonactinospora thermoautotrophica TaxID=1469144 RepID=UPI00227010DF|nr:hypothetical protein [Carbonactinospora thermoautotrophica]